MLASLQLSGKGSCTVLFIAQKFKKSAIDRGSQSVKLVFAGWFSNGVAGAQAKNVKGILTQNFAAKVACGIGSREHAFVICKISTSNIAWKVFYMNFELCMHHQVLYAASRSIGALKSDPVVTPVLLSHHHAAVNTSYEDVTTAIFLLLCLLQQATSQQLLASLWPRRTYWNFCLVLLLSCFLSKRTSLCRLRGSAPQFCVLTCSSIACARWC